MKSDKLIPGAILVCIGAVILLHNFNVIDFHWMNILHLWPIFLIIGGVNLVFAGNKSPLATILKLAVVIAGFALIVFGRFGDRYNFWPSQFVHFDRNDDDNDDDNDTTNTDHGVVKVEGSSVFNKEYTPDAKLARLNISGGGTTYTLSDTTNELFKAETKEFYGKYEFNASKEDSVYVVKLKMKDNNKMNFDSDNDKSNTAEIKLNPNPIWDINVEAGAAALNFDLSKFKVKNVTLKGGAVSYDLKLGDPLAVTNVDLSNAASGVTIAIPKTAACKITSNSGLSSTDFEGFIKKGDNDYETEGFATAKNKFIIHFSGFASGFEVSKY